MKEIYLREGEMQSFTSLSSERYPNFPIVHMKIKEKPRLEGRFLVQSGSDEDQKKGSEEDASGQSPDLGKQHKDEDETKKKPQRKGSINISYNGILSGDMRWNQDLLTQVTSSSDLRTQITVRNLSERTQLGTVNLGEVAAMKKFGDPMELFSQHNSPKKLYEVKGGFDIGRMDILIKDQQLADRVRERNNGRFDNGIFVSEVDNLTKKALGHILTLEKWHQFKSSGIASSVTAAECSLVTLATYKLGESIVSQFIDMFRQIGTYSDYRLFREFVDTLKLGGTTMLFGFALTTLVSEISQVLLKGSSYFSPVKRSKYLDAFEDYNPLKHGKDMSNGFRSLYKEKTPLVKLITK